MYTCSPSVETTPTVVVDSGPPDSVVTVIICVVGLTGIGCVVVEPGEDSVYYVDNRNE